MSARSVSILGSTGSVGRATLDLIARAEPGQTHHRGRVRAVVGAAPALFRGDQAGTSSGQSRSASIARLLVIGADFGHSVKRTCGLNKARWRK